MIWLTWRQHRTTAAIVFGVLTLLAIVLIVTGHEMRATYDSLGIAACVQPIDVGLTVQHCGDAIDAFRNQYGTMEAAAGWLNVIPILLAMLVGAPLIASEFEQRAHQLVWTQSVTRWRWLSVKLIAVLGGGLFVGAALWALLQWWLGPWNALDGRFGNGSFDFEGTALLGYIVFALALAVAAGTVVRRAVGAMVIALAGFLAVRLPIEFGLRPNFQPPLASIGPALGDVSGQAAITRADWTLRAIFINQAGQPLSDMQVQGACLTGVEQSKQSFLQCIQSHGWAQEVIFQPASRYWTFQAIETAIFVGLAALLMGLTIWWVRRRIA